MRSHFWGDGFDFKRLWDVGNKIAIEFESNVPGYMLIYKEKYGELVYEHIVPKDPTSLADVDQIAHWKVLWKIVQDTAKEYPDLKDELFSDIACHEEVVGEKIHNQYWTTWGKSEDKALKDWDLKSLSEIDDYPWDGEGG